MKKLITTIVLAISVSVGFAQVTATAVATSVSCFGSCDGTATGTPSGGVGPYTFSWTGPMGYTGSGVTIAGLCTGSYTLTITDAGTSSSDIDIVFVPEPSVLTATLLPGYTVCSGGCVTLTGTYTGGTPPYTYNWSPATGLSSPVIPNPVACPSASTFYTITISDSHGCVTTATTNITVGSPLSAPYIGPDDTISCGTTTYTLNSTTVAGAIAYVWTPGLGGTILSGQGTTSITVSIAPSTVWFGPVTTIYQCQAIDASGCNGNIGTMNLTMNANPIANFSIVPDSTTAYAYWTLNTSTGAGLTYAWDFGDASVSTLASPTHTYASAGVYYPCLTVNDGVCPSSTYCDSALVSGVLAPCNSLFNVSLNTTTPYYNDFTISNLSYGSPLTYFWDFGDFTGTSTLANPTYTYASIGPYQICLTVDNGAGCTTTYCDSVDGVDSLGHMPNQPITITVVNGNGLGASVGTGELGIRNYELGIYPNPSNSLFTLTTKSTKISSIIIEDITGRIITDYTYTNSTIDMSACAKGIYFVHIFDENKNETNKKIILQ